MKFFSTFIILFFVSSLLHAQKVEEGLIDLSKVDFTERVYALDGDWEFCWDCDEDSFENQQHIEVPGFWNSENNGSHPAFGQGVYKLKVLLPEDAKNLAIRVNDIHNAFAIYINGKLVHEHGHPTKEESDYKANWSPLILPIESPGTSMELMVVVANYGHRNGGFSSQIFIGEYQNMLTTREFHLFIDLIVIGGLAVLAIFFFAMFLLWRKDKAIIYFAGFALFFAFWMSFRGEKPFFSLWPGVNWSLAIRMEYLAMIVSFSFCVMFITRLFKKHSIPLVEKVYLAINGISILAILVLPTEIFTYLSLSSMVMMVILMGYVFYVFSKVALAKEPDGKYTILSVVMLVLVVVFGILNFTGAMHVNPVLIQLLTLTFIVSMSFIFANRFTGAFNEVVELKDIEEKQKLTLEEKNSEIIASINYAKKLQDAILPSESFMTEQLKDYFILYKPKDIVAGDFYWMEKFQGKTFLAAADCTGHGVPGALVSFVCSNALSKSLIEEQITDPGKLLDRTRELVIQRFSKNQDDLKDGMDISLICIDHDHNKISWAGAYNPLWIIRNGATEIEEIKGDKQPVGQYSRATPFTTHELPFQAGDKVYLFSDGYIDQFGGDKKKKFKTINFKKLLSSIQDTPISQQGAILDDHFEKWRNDLEQIDDVCVIGLKL